MAASLNDSAVLGANTLFHQRVQSSLARACIAISNEGLAVANHRDRIALVHGVLVNPTNQGNYTTMFAITVATDATVLSSATAAGTVPLTLANCDVQQALVTDAQINSAVDAQFNAFVSGIPA